MILYLNVFREFHLTLLHVFCPSQLSIAIAKFQQYQLIKKRTLLGLIVLEASGHGYLSHLHVLVLQRGSTCGRRTRYSKFSSAARELKDNDKGPLQASSQLPTPLPRCLLNWKLRLILTYWWYSMSKQYQDHHPCLLNLNHLIILHLLVHLKEKL